jgi:ribosome-associated toxin RatA of RatAB toxin-antitoxin module
MINAEHRFTLPVSPGQAFALLSDPAKDPEWQTACVEARLLDGPVRAGCRYQITFQLIGRRMTFTVEVLAYEPGACSEFQSVEGPFAYVGRYEYNERPDGTTDVDWTFRVDPGDYFGILPLTLVRKLLITQVKKDSGRLAERLRDTSTTVGGQERS